MAIGPAVILPSRNAYLVNLVRQSMIHADFTLKKIGDVWNQCVLYQSSKLEHKIIWAYKAMIK